MYKIHKVHCLLALKRETSWEMEMGQILKLARRLGEGGRDYDKDVAEMLAVDGSNGEKKIGWVKMFKALKEAARKKSIRR